MSEFSHKQHAPRDQRGSVAVVVALAMTVLLGLGGLGADVGYAFYAQKRLQGATDAAALAGAADLWSSPFSTAQANAMKYTAGQGNNDMPKEMAVSPATVTGLQLVNSQLPAAGAVSKYNGIQVVQQATVPLYFARLLGFNSMTVAANAKAAAGGAGSPAKYNVMIILDTTGSMDTIDDKCKGPNGKSLKRIDCAKRAAMTLLTNLTNAGDNVGLMVYPPLAGTADFGCTKPKQAVAGSYSAVASGVVKSGATYQVSGLGTDFLKNGVADKNSSVVQALGGGGCGGLSASGGLGTYFAQALVSAQAALVNMSQGQSPPGQNVIVLLSDGDASSDKGQLGTKYQGDFGMECKAAVTQANTIKSSGTLIYTTAYIGSGGNTTGSCSNGKNDLSPCDTMLGIASGPSNFFSDTCAKASGGHVDLNTAFRTISYSLTKPRLIPLNGA